MPVRQSGDEESRSIISVAEGKLMLFLRAGRRDGFDRFRLKGFFPATVDHPAGELYGLVQITIYFGWSAKRHFLA